VDLADARKFAGFVMKKTFFSVLGLLPLLSQGQHILSNADACTYYGSLGDDIAQAVAIDDAGNVFIVGNSNHEIEPGDTVRGQWDVFVAKFDANLENLLASMLFGGMGTDLAYDIAIDSGGSVLVAGRTSSIDFPTTSGAFKDSLTSPIDHQCGTHCNFSVLHRPVI